jgi:hypothetical protein
LGTARQAVSCPGGFLFFWHSGSADQVLEYQTLIDGRGSEAQVNLRQSEIGATGGVPIETARLPQKGVKLERRYLSCGADFVRCASGIEHFFRNQNLPEVPPDQGDDSDGAFARFQQIRQQTQRALTVTFAYGFRQFENTVLLADGDYLIYGRLRYRPLGSGKKDEFLYLPVQSLKVRPSQVFEFAN